MRMMMKEEEAEVERGTAAPTWTSPLPPEKRYIQLIIIYMQLWRLDVMTLKSMAYKEILTNL